MAEVLTVEQARSKVMELAPREQNLTSWKDKTKLTVKGVISRVGKPRPVSTPERPIDKDKEGRYRDVWLKQERGDNEPAFLKVTVTKNDWRDDVNKLSEKDIDTEQTFTGVASMWDDRASGEILYSLFGELGDGSRQRSGGGRYDDSLGKQRRIAGGMILNGNFAKGLSTDEAIAEVTPERITAFLERCKEPVSKKTEKPPEEDQEDRGEWGDEPFGK